MDRGTDTTHELNRGLRGYVRAVAAALDLPPQGTSFEVSDTATAYLALRRSPGRPGEELMLVWSERSGWALAVETEPASVLAYFGENLVPEPEPVRRFVREVLAGHWRAGRRPVFSTEGNRPELTKRLSHYV